MRCGALSFLGSQQLFERTFGTTPGPNVRLEPRRKSTGTPPLVGVLLQLLPAPSRCSSSLADHQPMGHGTRVGLADDSTFYNDDLFTKSPLRSCNGQASVADDHRSPSSDVRSEERERELLERHSRRRNGKSSRLVRLHRSFGSVGSVLVRSSHVEIRSCNLDS